MPLTGLLERRINGIPWADKLMEPESEGPGVRLRVFLAVVPGKEPITDHALTRALFHAGQAAQFPSDSSFPDDWPGSAAKQAPALCLATKTHAVFQPAGQRRADESLVLGRYGLLSTDDFPQQFGRSRLPRIRLEACSRQGLTDHVLRPNVRPEKAGGNPGDLLPLLIEGAPARHGRGCADAKHVLGLASHPQATDQKGDVSSLPPPVRMQLVEHEEAEIVSGVDEGPFEGSSQQQLEHDVVGQQNVGRVLDDQVPLLPAFLAGIAVESHGLLTQAESHPQELLELTVLAVAKRVHRIDDDRLNTLLSAIPQHTVDNRNQVGQALSRPGPRRQHVILAPSPSFDRLDLMAVEQHPRTNQILLRLDPEDLATTRVQQSPVNEIVDPATGFEAGVQLDQRLGPENFVSQAFLNELIDSSIANLDETTNVAGVVLDHAITQIEDVHRRDIHSRSGLRKPPELTPSSIDCTKLHSIRTDRPNQPSSKVFKRK